MTTIAFRDGIMAADSRAYSGDRKPVGFKQKIHSLSDGSLIGVSSSKVGEPERFRKMVEAHGVETAFDSEVLVQAIVVKPNGDIYYFNDEKAFSGPVTADFIAIGSGEMAAHAAMILGQNAKGAVAIALECDVWTGGEITTLALKQKK